MSKFFQNLDDEKQETQTKAREIVERSQEKMSKREIKYKELQDKINEVKNSGKNFEKNFKKFMNDAKKYVSYFENNNVPDFLLNFLQDERIQSSKPMLALSTEFLKPFTASEETTVISKKSISKKTKSLDSILLLENDQEKEPELLEFLEKCTDENSKSEIYIALFSIYSRMENSEKMIKIFKLMNLNLENPQMKGVVKNLDVYLSKISNIVGKDERESFIELLNYLEKSNFPIDKSIIQKKELEIEYFILGKSPENNHPLFKLLFLVRQLRWIDSLEYYNSHQDNFDSSKTSRSILIEFGKLAAKNSEFQISFNILSKCYKSEPCTDLKIILYSLCVILNRDLNRNEFFIEFIEDFKKLESNYCCLESSEASMELFRAFYFLNIFNFEKSASIVEKISGIQSLDYLKQQSTKLYEDMLKSATI